MRLIWSFLICLVIALPVSAQEKNQRSQQVETVKIAFITQKLNLNTSEAEKFWPVYNSYQSEMRELLKLKSESRNKKDAKAEDKLDNELDFESRMLDIRKKYQKEFSKVIPSEKVLQFYNAEREFREQMIKELRERRQKQ